MGEIQFKGGTLSGGGDLGEFNCGGGGDSIQWGTGEGAQVREIQFSGGNLIQQGDSEGDSIQGEFTAETKQQSNLIPTCKLSLFH